MSVYTYDNLKRILSTERIRAGGIVTQSLSLNTMIEVKI